MGIRIETTIKTRYSQFDAKEIGEFIHQQYGFQKMVDCRFFDNGMNDIYKVRVGDITYYYRVSLAGTHNKTDYEEEVLIILAFAEAGISVAKPIRMVNQEYISEFAAPEGIRYGILFEEAIETPCKEDDVDNKCEGMKVLGEYLARIHQYGDLHRGNVHFNGNKPTIFDFDCMGYGYRAYDICIYAWNESFHNQEYLNTDEWKSFLEGYESIRKLTEAEKECIPAFMALRQVWLMGLHADVMNRNAGCCWFQNDYFIRQMDAFRRYAKLMKQD